MKHLEFNFRMPGFLALEPATRRKIMEQASVEQMPADRATKMLERVGWAQQYIVMAKFQEAGVFITAEWSVLIMGQSYLHCVSVLCELLKLIEEVLDTHVSITLVTVLDKPPAPLYGYLVQQARLLTFRQCAVGAGLILTGAFAGAAVNNWIWPLLPGG